jgi:NAD(P)-dependent dehydrogenase (short-subunit alcohol dehydrogenase family)
MRIIHSVNIQKSEFLMKTVFISGAGGGLGKVLVKEFLGIGYRVIAAEHDEGKLAELERNPELLTVKLDVTDPSAIKTVCEKLDLSRTGIDLLISQAGIYDSFPVTEADPGRFSRIMEVNLMGTVSLIQGLLRPLIRNKGRVIVVSSESYKVQALFQPYMISKAALESYCMTARQELALKGIKLIVVRPGAMNTPLLDWMKTSVTVGNYPVYQKEFQAGLALSAKMVGKIIPPEAVASLIARAATVSNPKRTYRINNSFIVKVISLLPAGLFDKLVINKLKNT